MFWVVKIARVVEFLCSGKWQRLGYTYMSWWEGCLASQDVNIGELVAFKLSIGQTIFSLATALGASRLKMPTLRFWEFWSPWLVWLNLSIIGWWVAALLFVRQYSLSRDCARRLKTQDATLKSWLDGSWFWVVSCRLVSFQLARQYSLSALDAWRLKMPIWRLVHGASGCSAPSGTMSHQPIIICNVVSRLWTIKGKGKSGLFYSLSALKTPTGEDGIFAQVKFTNKHSGALLFRQIFFSISCEKQNLIWILWFSLKMYPLQTNTILVGVWGEQFL